MMRDIGILSFLLFLSSLSVNAGKVKRQTFNDAFRNNQQPTNFGQFLGGLFGQRDTSGANTNTNPFATIFDSISGSLQQGNNNNKNNQNPFNFGTSFQGSQGCSFNNGGCQQGCRMLHGRKQCYCHDGYHIHIADGSCHDNDECLEFRPCEDKCENTLGSYKCSCSSGSLQPDGSCNKSGFNIGGGSGHSHGSGNGAQFRKSCGNNNGGCEQICVQNRNAVQCQCEVGYVRSPQNLASCIDIDECSTGAHGCNGRCMNTIGSYSCQGISFPIASHPICSINNGGCQDKCRETANGVSCRCSRQFVLQSDQKSCGCPSGTMQIGNQCLGASGNNRRVNCNRNNGGCQQMCKTRGRGRRARHICVCDLPNFKLEKDKRSCACKNRFTLSDDKLECIEKGTKPEVIDPCAKNKGGCQQNCMWNGNEAQCYCDNFYSLAADGKSCTPQNPCNNKNGGCDHICTNNNGQASCSCTQGWLLAGNEKGCTEKPREPQVIDPCLVNRGGCHQLCRANGNQPQCYCQDSYYLAPDSISCIPNDPCTVQNGGCAQICKNNGGQASCGCRTGWKLATNGRKCTKIATPDQNPTTAPPRQGCGVNNKKDLLRRIVGGKPADPKDWPWMAAILRKHNQDQFCGGVLITDRHVLTASHCLVDFTKDELLVRLGEYDFSSTTENSPTDFAVVDVRLHESYNRSSQENDIALLKLDRPSSFSEFIWPVCLPPADQDFMNQLGYVTGWGTTSFGGKVSKILQEIIIPVWAQTDCQTAYPSKVVSTMMCAGLREGGKDSCQGDSGGPYLVQIYPSSRWFVIGVVSWGIKCAEAGNPGVYTRVNQYLPWIRANAVF